MGKYKESEATVMICKKQNGVAYTTVKIEPFDNKGVFSNSPRSPASLVPFEGDEATWRFGLHRAIKINGQEISFETYIVSNDLPAIGHTYIFRQWWTSDQLEAAQSDSFDWEKQKFSPPHPKWDHEHCITCWEHISEYEGEQHFGYVRFNFLNKEEWICEKCYTEYIVSGLGKKLGDDIG